MLLLGFHERWWLSWLAELFSTYAALEPKTKFLSHQYPRYGSIELGHGMSLSRGGLSELHSIGLEREIQGLDILEEFRWWIRFCTLCSNWSHNAKYQSRVTNLVKKCIWPCRYRSRGSSSDKCHPYYSESWESTLPHPATKRHNTWANTMRSSWETRE